MKNIRNHGFVKYTVLAIIGFLLASCEGFQEEYITVSVPVDNVEIVVVINAEIEKDSSCWVQISYSEDIDALVGTPIRFEENAIVNLETNSGEVETLGYTGNGTYVGNSIIGTVGDTYTLNVNIEDQTYTAISTMLREPGYQNAWINAGNVNTVDGKSIAGVNYSEQWIVNDPSSSRNHYFFEWYTNGVHNAMIDWAIDDNRVVNSNEGLQLFNPTTDPNPNEYIVFRTAEIDKPTYDYYNMYEKIVRGIAGADSQTPYNPISNFGDGTIGNFRAVSFSSIVLLTSPNIFATKDSLQNIITFPVNDYFSNYNLYWKTSPGITKENSHVINDIQFEIYSGGGGKNGNSGDVAAFTHTGLTSELTYYYRIEVEDADGNVSILSPEVTAVDNIKGDDGKGGGEKP